MLGGWLGQLMIVFNTLAQKYKTLDKDKKTSSSKGTPKSQKSDKSDKSGAAEAKGETRKLINANVVQEFIYNYIAEKLKSE